MGRYVTPRGVVVEVSDVAALNVGYKPADEPKPTTAEEKKTPSKSTPKKTSSSGSKK